MIDNTAAYSKPIETDNKIEQGGTISYLNDLRKIKGTDKFF